MKYEEELNSIKKELQAIQNFLDSDAVDDLDVLVERLSIMNVYLARSGKLMADAKYIEAKIKNEFFDANEEAIFNLSPSIVKELLNAKSSEASYVANWAERINRAIVHSGDNIRTQVSFGKENLKLTRSGY